MIEWLTGSPSGSVADTAPADVPVAAVSAMVSVYDDAPNSGARLHAPVVWSAGSEGSPQTAAYTVPSP